MPRSSGLVESLNESVPPICEHTLLPSKMAYVPSSKTMPQFGLVASALHVPLALRDTPGLGLVHTDRQKKATLSEPPLAGMSKTMAISSPWAMVLEPEPPDFDVSLETFALIPPPPPVNELLTSNVPSLRAVWPVLVSTSWMPIVKVVPALAKVIVDACQAILPPPA